MKEKNPLKKHKTNSIEDQVLNLDEQESFKITLNKSSHLQIVAPSAAKPAVRNEILNKAIEAISKKDICSKVFSSKDIFLKDNQPLWQREPLWAAPKADRIKDFKGALFNKEGQIIWCFAGGYGASELL